MGEGTGLTTEKAQKRLKQFGLNILPEKPPPSSFLILLDQFKSPLVYVLLLAALVTLFLRDLPDTAIILLAVFLNTVLGFYQERKAKKALYALSRILSPQTKVRRDGKERLITAREVVPGDLVVLELGEKVPADGTLTEAIDLTVSEAVLTGESQPVRKGLKEQVFAGTIVSSGRGVMLVEKTGPETRLGQIATALEVKEEQTPLEKKIAGLASSLALLVGVICFLLFVSGLILGKDLIEMFMTSVAIAVAAIPEGLIVSLTVILAIGMQRILKRKALVRNLASAETLGSVTVICADKTGTLTEGKMRVVREDFTDRQLGFRASLLCNNLRDPLEYAMKEYAEKELKLTIEEAKSKYPRLDEIPFSPQTKVVATLHPGIMFVSGAPEIIIENCKLQISNRKMWLERFDQYGREGYRMVGFAYKKIKSLKSKIKNDDLESLEWLGLLLYEDPVRPEVADSLKKCQEAGIKVKVITGDHVATSVAVLKKLGFKVKTGEIIGGEELAKLTTQELKERISRIVLFARTDPLQKLKIIEALKEKGEVVAMMGDGVNDAPALAKADIGIVVGQASEVAKETADMILLDSNFATIAAAIEEGRGIFDNLRKVILYLLSDVFDEVAIILGAILLGLPLPLLAGQILWINLVSDGLPALALTIDPKREGLMKRPPQDPQEAILNSEIKGMIGIISFFVTLPTLFLFWFFLKTTGDLLSARSLTFALFGTQSLFYVFSCRSLYHPVWQNKPLSNPWLIVAIIFGFLLLFLAIYYPPLAAILKVAPLGIFEWGVVMATSLAVVILIEAAKLIFVLKSSQTR